MAFAGQFRGGNGQAAGCRPLLPDGLGHQRIIGQAVAVLAGILDAVHDFALGIRHHDQVHLPSLKGPSQQCVATRSDGDFSEPPSEGPIERHAFQESRKAREMIVVRGPSGIQVQAHAILDLIEPAMFEVTTATSVRIELATRDGDGPHDEFEANRHPETVLAPVAGTLRVPFALLPSS